MDRLKSQPVIGPLFTLIDRWPRLSAWIVLSVGCVALLVYEARDVGLTTTNWIALILATVLVAGLCIWIVSWEDHDELDQPVTADKKDTLEIEAERHDA